jgi:tetratricopeptide (TPR) repeat protein
MKSLDWYWLRAQAVVWILVGRRAQALEVFNQMVRRFPTESYPLASRAHLLAQGGQHDESLADYRRLTELHTDHAPGWFNLGFVLESLGRYEEARQAFERATTLDPKLDRGWYGLGLVLIRLQRFDEAVAALKRNTELQPMSPYGWYQLARVHVDRQQPEEAAKIIRHLQGFEPKVAAQLVRETGLLVGQTAN